MRKIKLDANKIVGVSGSGRRVGSEKTGTTEKELVEAPMRKPAKQKYISELTIAEGSGFHAEDQA